MVIRIEIWKLEITLNILKKSSVADMDFYFYFSIMWGGFRRIFMIALVKDYQIYLEKKALSFSIGILKYFWLRYLKKGEKCLTLKKKWKEE